MKEKFLDNSLIGRNIQMLRTSSGLTKRELAKLLDLSPSLIGMIERGIRGATLTNVIRLSQIFETSIDSILLGSFKEYEPKGTNELIFQSLDESEQNFITGVIRLYNQLKEDKAHTPK